MYEFLRLPKPVTDDVYVYIIYSCYNGYQVFPGGQAAGAWHLPPTPI